MGDGFDAASLRLAYRSTQGGRQVLHLPIDAIVTGTASDGTALTVRPVAADAPRFAQLFNRMAATHRNVAGHAHRDRRPVRAVEQLGTLRSASARHECGVHCHEAVPILRE